MQKHNKFTSTHETKPKLKLRDFLKTKTTFEY